MKKNILIVILLFLSQITYAGVESLTFHTRGNSTHNESITWDDRWHRVYRTLGYHTSVDGMTHTAGGEWEKTEHSVAAHLGERAQKKWSVYGYHYLKLGRDELYLGSTTNAGNDYDGWYKS